MIYLETIKCRIKLRGKKFGYYIIEKTVTTQH